MSAVTLTGREALWTRGPTPSTSGSSTRPTSCPLLRASIRRRLRRGEASSGKDRRGVARGRGRCRSAGGRGGCSSSLRRSAFTQLPTSRFVTTAHAAAYCDMSLSGFKNAARRGRASPAGRRGGDGDLTWRLQNSTASWQRGVEAGMEWVKRWNMWIAREASLPGCGGIGMAAWSFAGTRRILRSGRLVEIKKYLPEATANVGLAWLEGERQKVRQERRGQERSPIHFHAFAARLLERKIESGGHRVRRGPHEVEARPRAHPDGPLGGVLHPQDRHADLAAWRELFPRSTYSRVRRMVKKDPETGMSRVERVVETKPYESTTLNTWLAVLSTVSAAMTREHKLPRDPALGLKRSRRTCRTNPMRRTLSLPSGTRSATSSRR